MKKKMFSIMTVFALMMSFLSGCVPSIPSTDPEREIDFYVNLPPTNLSS